MDASFLGRGWAFPVRVDPRTGRIATVAEEDDIRQAIWIILSTAKGERVMRPDFGCGIHDLIFDSVSTVTAGLLENHVREALIRYEARIEVVRLDVRTAEADRGRLLLELHYRVRRTNHEFNLVYPFFLSEGT
jgi:uncharacterized protein